MITHKKHISQIQTEKNIIKNSIKFNFRVKNRNQKERREPTISKDRKKFAAVEKFACEKGQHRSQSGQRPQDHEYQIDNFVSTQKIHRNIFFVCTHNI